MKFAIITVTERGYRLANAIKKNIDADIYSKYNNENFNIRIITKLCMEKYIALIFITATGIAVRCIAPYLKSKDVDPAVIVVDCTGNYVISLLSGHLGGANEYTKTIANILNAKPIITTASDNLGYISPDIIAQKNGLQIDDLEKLKEISALLVEGRDIVFVDVDSIIPCPYGYVDIKEANKDNLGGMLFVGNNDNTNDYERLFNIKVCRLIRKNVILGVGCRKGYDSNLMIEFVYKQLAKLNIDERAVKIVTTIDIKKEEEAIVKLAKEFNAEFKTWNAESIKVVQDNYGGSDFVEKTVGVRAVCEPCVELCKATFMSGKIIHKGMTLCIGKEFTPVN